MFTRIKNESKQCPDGEPSIRGTWWRRTEVKVRSVLSALLSVRDTKKQGGKISLSSNSKSKNPTVVPYKEPTRL